jgi:hypothetical protein
MRRGWAPECASFKAGAALLTQSSWPFLLHCTWAVSSILPAYPSSKYLSNQHAFRHVLPLMSPAMPLMSKLLSNGSFVAACIEGPLQITGTYQQTWVPCIYPPCSPQYCSSASALQALQPGLLLLLNSLLNFHACFPSYPPHLHQVLMKLLQPAA